MPFWKRRWANLTSRLSWQITLAVLLLLLVLGAYFDVFLRQSFQDAARDRMQHTYLRLHTSLRHIEAELADGILFAQTDESLIASIDLVNRFEDRAHYNTFLIDEEKKTLAQALLSRVKLSFNDDVALYGANGDLLAFASRQGRVYRLGYVSYASGKPQLMSKLESQADYDSSPLLQQPNIPARHVPLYSPQQMAAGHVLTRHRLEQTLVLKTHLQVSDPRSGREMAHMELSRLLGAEHFAEFSNDFDAQVALHFDAPEAAAWTLDFFSPAIDPQALKPVEEGGRYISVAQAPVVGGTAYFSIGIDKHLYAELVNAHRLRFGVLLTLLAGVLLWAMHGFIRRTLAQPLAAVMAQIGHVERGHYTQMPALATGDELQAISTSINTLAQAVQERERSLEQARQEQEYLSLHDALTGLANRRLFSQRLEQALDLARRNQTQVAVLFLDLDDFKVVNDTLGHEVGDRLLVKVGERLQAHTRREDTLARIGGDEFNVLVENVGDVAEVEAMVAGYVGLLRQPIQCGEHTISSTVSIGVAVYPRDGADSVALLQHADLAVYQSKDAGRDGYSFYSHGLSQRARERAEMVHALNEAIEAGDQFRLVFQPKVSAQTGRVVSAEALIRWHSPKYGQVSPFRFISLAEETGQIIDIGAWVLRQGCRDMARMLAQGVSLQHLSMNVSTVQLRSPDFGEVLLSAIAAAGVQPNRIELEVTESCIANDARQAIQTLQSFRDMGVQLAIDDFGTGYSSMSYLQKMPFTRIKIDKSFVDGLPHNRDSISIVRAILALAKNFGQAVTAEGVEHADQMQFLRQAGCDEIQGYLYAKPMPLPEFLAYCQAHIDPQI